MTKRTSPAVSAPCAKIEVMHSIEEVDQIETPDGRERAEWRCECGAKGSGATPQAAIAGWKRHAHTRARSEY